MQYTRRQWRDANWRGWLPLMGLPTLSTVMAYGILRHNAAPGRLALSGRRNGGSRGKSRAHSMKCPYCGYIESRVTDSRDQGGSIHRRRRCEHCHQRFSTVEHVVLPELMVVKRDGRREPFKREKMETGLRRACQKRPIPVGELEAIVDEIENDLYKLARPRSRRADRRDGDGAAAQARRDRLYALRQRLPLLPRHPGHAPGARPTDRGRAPLARMMAVAPAKETSAKPRQHQRCGPKRPPPETRRCADGADAGRGIAEWLAAADNHLARYSPPSLVGVGGGRRPVVRCLASLHTV